MIGLTARGIVLLVTGIVVSTSLARAGEPTPSEREAMYYRYLEFPSYVKGGSIEPHWMADGSSFWYAEGAPENTVVWKIDPVANTKEPLFDAKRLRKSLAEILGHELLHQGLPFVTFSFEGEGEKSVKFTVEKKDFILQLDTHTITRAPALSEEEEGRRVPQEGEVASPDGRWFASVRNYNLLLRSTDDGHLVQLTTDGAELYRWGARTEGAVKPNWSPNGLKLALTKTDLRNVPRFPSVDYLGQRAQVQWRDTPQAGGPMPQTELFIVDILSQRQIRVDTGEEPDQYIYILGWLPNGSELLFFRQDREAKKLELMAANSTDGSTRIVLTETVDTFHQANPWWGWAGVFTLLKDGKEFIWLSERDGWNHLYLYDMAGTLIRRLTRGAFPVNWVDAVDEEAGWVYFTANADQQRPYDKHLWRANLEGEGFELLTEVKGQHRAQFSASKKFFLDTHSSVNRPPAVELRRADGTLLQTLSEANIDALEELQWRPPEEFVVRAADGKTALYGILFKPYDFDPVKKYPVIELIYGGPQAEVVPRSFTPSWVEVSGYPRALVQLGFIVFILDGRGTAGRGKEFQDVTYGQIGRHEIPDHMAALKQLAEERPYMDLSRVGIVGYSWGGYFALRALLLAPDVYHVGIAGAPVAELYSWNRAFEPYMGLPQNNREGYDYASNLRLAGNLRGKLLFIVGTSDVLISDTMKMAEVLIRAGKPFDQLMVPGQNHSFPHRPGEFQNYFWEAIRRYFQEHLKP